MGAVDRIEWHQGFQAGIELRFRRYKKGLTFYHELPLTKQPMKIDTLARNMIKLCGLQPDVDIKIEYTGLRPGEKLYEEKLMAEEGMEKTRNELIHIGHPLVFDEGVFIHQMEQLQEAANDGDEDIRDLIAHTVPTYGAANV